MKLPFRLVGIVLLSGGLTLAPAQFISVSVEQNNQQTGNATTAVDHYSFFASVEELTGVTGGTVSATAGTLTTPAALVDEGAELKEVEATNSTLGGILTAYPLGATYTIATTGSPSGNVTVAGSGGTFPDYNPVTPLFTLTGLSGSWSGSTYTFSPSGVPSFTVTLNDYAVTNPGGHYGWYLRVVNTTGGSFTAIGEVGGGPVADATDFTTPTITFTAGAALNGGDSDANTYGFSAGNQFQLEAGFFNVIGLTDSGLGDGSQKAFIVGGTTAFNLHVIPEPATYAAIFGGLALTGVVLQRRRRAA